MVSNYLDLLKEELSDAKKRFTSSSVEGKGVITRQIQEINRDILRLSEIERSDFALKRTNLYLD